MSPEQTGADIFRKWANSPFVSKTVCINWVEEAKERVTKELEYGFYKAEAQWLAKHPDGKKDCERQ